MQAIQDIRHAPAVNLLRDLLHQPVVLVVAVLLGAWTGVCWPHGAALFGALAGVYLALIQAAALPLLMLAAYFGLQRLAADGAPWRRIGMLAMLGLLVMLLCALGGAVLTDLSGAGGDLNASQKALLGRLTMGAEAARPQDLHDGLDASASATVAAAAVDAASSPAATIVPSNLYAAMAFGAAPTVLIGVLLFGAAVAVQRPSASGQLNAIMEALYRGMERVVRSVNIGLPLTAFVLAAAATSTAGADLLALLASLLGVWYGAVAVVGVLAVALICRRLKAHPWRVLKALREPVTVCLFAPVGAAALPEFIEALSVRLGFGRGVVELLASVFPTFIKTGEAMFFAVLAVFIANLYGRPLAPADLLLIGLLACWTALWSFGARGAKAALWSGVLQASLGLPLDALLPALVSVEVLCAGARSLVSYLAAAALVALAEDILPATELAPDDTATAAPAAPLLLVLALGRRQAWAGLALLAAALLSVFGAGFGMGLRKILLTTL
jgi:aerobic C4-dicarboxylate transport protein